MRESRRARRMARAHARHGRGRLNMVSLMDIFTILVFFLLVNSSDVEVLSEPDGVTLPDSLAEERTRESVVVAVTPEEIRLQGRFVASVADVLAEPDDRVAALTASLLEGDDRQLRAIAALPAAEREITVMGDRTLPWHLLERVMASCSEAGFGRVSLAVREGAGGGTS